MNANLFEEYQKQLIQGQKAFFETWMENIPKVDSQFDYSDYLGKSITSQQELVKTTLENHKLAFEIIIESQQKLWDNYFDLLHKTTTTKE